MNDQSVNELYGVGGLLQTINAGLVTAGKNLDALMVDDLAPIDAFHTRGRESTVEVAELSGLSSTDRILDVGCGLGGTVRFLAHKKST